MINLKESKLDSELEIIRNQMSLGSGHGTDLMGRSIRIVVTFHFQVGIVHLTVMDLFQAYTSMIRQPITVQLGYLN